MVRHIILWQLKDDIEKESVKKAIKDGLENLKGSIPGLIDIKVNINPLHSSNADLILDSSFDTEEALKEYSVNPLHVKVASEIVRPNVKQRVCMDYEE